MVVARRKMTNKKQTHEDLALYINKPTPALDEIKNKINKLLAAGVATFIPEACNALKQDWVPNMSNEVLKQNPALQGAMRNKILGSFAKERTIDGIWKESSIESCFEDFLRYPSFQESNKENSKKGREAIKYRKELESKGISEDFRKIIRKSPEPPKEILEQEEEQEEEPIATSAGGPYQTPEKELPSPEELYVQGGKAAEKLWTALTGKDRLIASQAVDVLLEHIKPTRKFRLRLFKGLDTARANHYQMVLIWLDKLIQDTLKDCLEINRERKTDEISK